MRKILLKIKNLSLVTIIASLLIGAFALIKPAEFVRYVSMIFGAVLILLGVICLILYFTKDKTNIASAVLGAFGIIIGIIVCVKYKSIISIMLFMLGLFIVVSGIVDFFSALQAKKFNLGVWAVSLVLSIITIILGVVVTANPFDSMELLVRLLGIGLVVYAVMDIIAFVQVKKVASIIGKEQIDVQANEVEEE